MFRSWKSFCAALAVATPLAGCGLKGPLELPERPTNIVIRPAPGTAGTESTPPPTTSGTAPATTPAEDESERPPPPDLPRGQRGGAS